MSTMRVARLEIMQNCWRIGIQCFADSVTSATFCWFVGILVSSVLLFVGIQQCFAGSLAHSSVLLVRWHTAMFCWFVGVQQCFAGSLAYSSVLLIHTALFCWFIDIQHCFGVSEALAVFLLVRWHTHRFAG